jgi:hypothetical protein
MGQLHMAFSLPKGGGLKPSKTLKANATKDWQELINVSLAQWGSLVKVRGMADMPMREDLGTR